MMSKYLEAGAPRHLCSGPTCFFMLACLISMSNLHPGVCFYYYNEGKVTQRSFQFNYTCLRVEKVSLPDKTVPEAPLSDANSVQGLRSNHRNSSLSQVRLSLPDSSFTRLGPQLHYPTSEGTGVSLLVKADTLCLSPTQVQLRSCFSASAGEGG